MRQIEYSKTRLVSRHPGTLPVLLTCPHDGNEAPAGVPERTGPTPECSDFEPNRDLRTRAITTGVAQRLLDLTGEAPSVVIAEYHRRYIDANRSAACAFEHSAQPSDAQQFYDEYHNTIRQFIDQIRAENGGLGLLFDIHGTAGIEQSPADLYLGTVNGKTVTRLLRADPRAMQRPRSLRGFLEAAGYVVVAEMPALIGGYTVRRYGSSNPDGLDAIQIEIDAPLRRRAPQREALIEHLAQAIGRLAVLWADVRTMAAFRSIDLVAGELVTVVTGQLRRDPESGDGHLGLGGEPQNRGRVEIRRDPGATGEPPNPRRAGVLVLYSEDGNDHYLWVDNEGRLRISPTDPGADSQGGTVVGAQT
ncbi:MAG TPA: N-formylglutamate amidohydrolase [Geminicoccaceae bacterium]|nr:N-formylglutamate amidohydrolase [Geminicoccaceae bacterium]